MLIFRVNISRFWLIREKSKIEKYLVKWEPGFEFLSKLKKTDVIQFSTNT